MDDIDPRFMVMRSPKEVLRRRMSVAARLCGAMLLGVGVFWGIYFLYRGHVVHALLDAGLVSAALGVMLLHRRGKVVLAVKLALVAMLFYLVPMALLADSHTATLPRSVQNGLLPVGVAAYLLFRGSESRFGNGVMLLCLALTVVLSSSPVGVESALTLPDEVHRVGVWINNGLAYGFLYVQLHHFVSDVGAMETQLMRTNNRFVARLAQAFPRSVAERMLSERGSFAKRHGQVSVLFADLAGFTQLAEAKSATEVVELLERVFSAFDAATEQLGLTKIKTIGDAYMAAAGVPEADAAHARKAVELGRRMQSIMRWHGPLQLRVGIATGDVVAGVIGQSRQTYDVWGDTVNTAARLEGAAPPGRILVDAATRAACGSLFNFEPPASLQLKGKSVPVEASLVAPLKA